MPTGPQQAPSSGARNGLLPPYTDVVCRVRTALVTTAPAGMASVLQDTNDALSEHKKRINTKAYDVLHDVLHDGLHDGFHNAIVSYWE